MLEDETNCRRKAERKSEDLQVSLLDRDNEVKAHKLQASRAKEDLVNNSSNSFLHSLVDKAVATCHAAVFANMGQCNNGLHSIIDGKCMC